MLKALKISGRRLQQMGSVLFTSNYHKQEAANKRYNDRYANPEELNYYVDIAFEGLDEREAPRLNNILENHVRRHKKFLIVGCGTGREVFALKDKFESSFGIDTCLPMIEKAKLIQQEANLTENITFTHIDQLSEYNEQDFDLIYLTVTLMNHMKGRDHRIHFYHELKHLLSPHGILCGFSNIVPMKRTHHFYWVSQVLRFKSFLSGDTWEQGDSIRDYLGSHTTLNFPIFYHFDQSQEHVLNELSEAKLKPQFLFQDFWLASGIDS